MDLEHATPRTASQVSLRSTPKGQSHLRYSNTSQNFSRPSPQRTPLRAVNNNATLLRSPGPLESMLKTTTETGDIGLFTIAANISATYHQPPRPRPSLPGGPLARSVHSRRHPQRDDSQDDRMRLPSSYRDTTSEILSLYGSEAHKSRTFTPSNDDAQRSYSLTTCSSRYIPSQKSSATLQSASTVSGLQRPRSPFPYPTRLKRPGARPASPAVTDNGEIDYTRMVELDRSYKRPAYGCHRPPHTYGSRCAPPLSHRSEGNRSTASLPSRSSPGPYSMSPAHCLSRTSTSYHAKAPRPPGRSQRGSNSNEQGLRSPSLTSIVEMYQRPATVNSHVPSLHSTGSFYYDYSEEFEKVPSPLAEPKIPLCPIPQRAPSLGRPMVLRAEEKGSLDYIERSNEDAKENCRIARVPEEGLRDENAPDPGQHAGACKAISLPHKQEETPQAPELNPKLAYSGIDGAGNTQGVDEARCQTTYGRGTQKPTSETMTTRDEKHAELSADSNTSQYTSVSQCRNRSSSIDNPALGTAVLSPGKRCRRSKTIGARVDHDTHIARNKSASYSNLVKLRNTLEPSLVEFASLVTSFDRLTKSPFPKRGTSRTSSEGTEKLIWRISQSQDDESPQPVSTDGLKVSFSQQSFEATEESGRPFHKRHRRNLAATRISTTNIAGSKNTSVASQGFSRSLGTIAPEPISSTHQLKVKRSIPQLMKALPPLPAEAEMYNYETSKEACSERTPEKCEDGEETYGHLESSTGPSPPKLKLRVKPLPSNPIPNEHALSRSLREQPLTVDSAGSPGQRKLKIKISRNAVPTHTGKDGTVLRSPALKQCNSLADLEHCARKDIFTRKSHLQNAFSKPTAESQEDVEAIRDAQNSALAVDQYHIRRRGAVGTGLEAQPSTPSGRPGLRRACSMILETGQGEHQGLRQKLSFLRLRLGTSQGGCEHEKKETLFPSGIRGGPSSSQALSPEDDLKEHQFKVVLLRSGNAKRRVRRWARGAKNAMRRAMRKTLDRSANMTT